MDDASHRLAPKHCDPVSRLAGWIQERRHDVRHAERHAYCRVVGLGHVAVSYLQ
jgi:hypothetical protein